MSGYRFESLLVEDFLLAIDERSPWGEIKKANEFPHMSGRTDVVAYSPKIGLLTFEAKLTKWRDALQQAYRNTVFSNMSYVVLPRHSARQALQFENEFVMRNVGLCIVNNGVLEIIISPKKIKEPLNTWLYNKAIVFIKGALSEGTADRTCCQTGVS